MWRCVLAGGVETAALRVSATWLRYDLIEYQYLRADKAHIMRNRLATVLPTLRIDGGSKLDGHAHLDLRRARLEHVGLPEVMLLLLPIRHDITP